MPYAVLLDTVSIQKFIYSTNNLKENLGASTIVEWIFQEPLIEAIQSIYPEFSKDIYESWHENPQKILTENGAKVEIGYIGGGNAMIIFKEQSAAEDFVKIWSRNLLIKAPSIIPAAAIGEINLNNNFSNTLLRLFDKLTKNKSEFLPITNIPRHGITAECSRTGLSREVWSSNLLPEADYISSVAFAKLYNAERAKRKHEKILEELGYSSYYCFTSQLDRLGQKKGVESHIAIVHIDGNDMSKRIRETRSLYDLRKLSKALITATKDSLKDMLKTLIDKMPEIQSSELFLIQQEEGRKILPIRPIVIGGDDITFVCDGRLGIWLAKVYLEAFSKKIVPDKLPLSACAGVSITKTKYPFYRGYQISEELLRNAKKVRKEKKDRGCWIDFHISYGGISGSLEQIRENQYETPDCHLLLRPYRLEDLNEMIRALRIFTEKDKNGKPKFPKSKLHKIKEALYSSSIYQEKLLEDFKSKDISLPPYGEDFPGNRLVYGKKTPYFDMIELLEFYPEFALKEDVDEKV